MVLGKLAAHRQKNEVKPISITYIKINSKFIKDLNVKAEVLKLLEGKVCPTRCKFMEGFL